MKSYADRFEDFKDVIWLNAASEGPLPKTAISALNEAIGWKATPQLLTDQKFTSVPKQLKESIGKLINILPREIIIGDSASYGIHLLANGMTFERGDQILLMKNDFPSNILPWLYLEKQGVDVRQIDSSDSVLTPEELENNITPKTKVLCISHVHSFSGIKLEIEKMSQICEKNNVRFIVNITQSAGTMPIDFSGFKIDALVCAGYKWLCGPYGTGFCWIKNEFREELDINRAYWPAYLNVQELHQEDEIKFKELKTTRKFDMFGTANFFNYVPWKSSIDTLLDIGLDKVRAYHDQIIDHFLKQLDLSKYELLSPKEGPARSSLIALTHNHKELNFQIHQKLAEKNIFLALWKNNLRIAPHIYNSLDQMDQLTEELNGF